MCGILGIVKASGNQFSDFDSRTLARLVDTLSERGPDGLGVFERHNVGFGHRRLAIRDQRQGQQPWLDPSGRCVLVYNGELYNDLELRRELSSGYDFRTTCDTEVVMAAYLAWGRSCVDRFRGMFAFGIYDFQQRFLWIVRDRFGIKPLFYAHIGGDFVFASRVATLVDHPKFSKQPDWDVVSHYLTTTRITLGRRTMYQGISQLQPAEQLLLAGDQFFVDRYWQYPVDVAPMSYDDAADQLQTQLNDSVEIRLRSDVPVGMFLSGGVDSSIIASLMHRSSPSARFATCAAAEAGQLLPEQDDFAFATCCADEVGAELTPVQVNSNLYVERWQELVRDFRLPLSTPSDVLIYEIAKSAKRNVGVVLGGEGSDELLCGYEIAHWAGHDYDATQMGEGFVDSSILDSIQRQYGRSKFNSQADHYFALHSLVPSSIKPRVLNQEIWDSANNDYEMFAHYQRLFGLYDGLSTVEKNAIILHQVNLEALLSRLDSTTMHAGLEARVPFTDHLLVESMFRIPFHYRIDAIHPRTSRRLASAELAAQDRLRGKRVLRTVANRLLPPQLANRKKASFPTAVQGWFHSEWKNWVADFLSTSHFAKFLLAEEFREELIQSPQLGGMWLWPIVNLSIWGDNEFFTAVASTNQ